MIHDLSYRIEVDVRSAPDADCETFGTTTTLDFTSTGGATFLDFLGGVDAVSLDGAPLVPEEVFDGARISLPELSAGQHRVVVVEHQRVDHRPRLRPRQSDGPAIRRQP